MNNEKHPLKVNLDDLQDAFATTSEDARYYLNLQTGEILLVTEDARSTLEELLEGHDVNTLEAINELIRDADVADWEKDNLYVAAIAEIGEDLAPIPRQDSRDGYEEMVAFIETITDERLQEEFQDAIRGKGAFRRFRSMLARNPDAQGGWYQFRDERLHQLMLRWLARLDIDPVI